MSRSKRGPWLGLKSALDILPTIDPVDVEKTVLTDTEFATLSDEISDLTWAVHDVLADCGYNCVGAARSTREARVLDVDGVPVEPPQFEPIVPNDHQHDEFWGGDLMELAWRTLPHDIRTTVLDPSDPAGRATIAIVQTVALKMETLRIEVDEFNEITAWIYEES